MPSIRIQTEAVASSTERFVNGTYTIKPGIRNQIISGVRISNFRYSEKSETEDDTLDFRRYTEVSLLVVSNYKN